MIKTKNIYLSSSEVKLFNLRITHRSNDDAGVIFLNFRVQMRKNSNERVLSEFNKITWHHQEISVLLLVNFILLVLARVRVTS